MRRYVIAARQRDNPHNGVAVPGNGGFSRSHERVAGNWREGPETLYYRLTLNRKVQSA
jgi:hypothetical protein